MKPALRKVVTNGLYRKNVIVMFNPPFNKLKGKKAGINSVATASLGYPTKK